MHRFLLFLSFVFSSCEVCCCVFAAHWNMAELWAGPWEGESHHSHLPHTSLLSGQPERQGQRSSPSEHHTLKSAWWLAVASTCITCVTFLCWFVQNMVSFHNVGALLGRLSPRCSDPLPAIRAAAIDCIYSLLYIQLRYEGTPSYEEMYSKILSSVCYATVKMVEVLRSLYSCQSTFPVFLCKRFGKVSKCLFCRVLLGL